MRPARRSPTSSAASPTPIRRSASRRSSTTRMHQVRQGGRLEGADGLDRRRLELSRARATSPAPSSAIWNRCSAIYDGAADRLAALHRAQALRAGLLFDRRAGLGHQLPDRQHARRARLLPRRSRPPRAEHQHRDDRRAADPVQEARRLPLQRFEIRRRRPRFRRDQSLPALPRLQRAGRRGACRARRTSRRRT